MRFMILVKATEESEAGVMPSTELLAAMMRYNEELVRAGVMQDGDGLTPSARGARVRFAGDQRRVIDGPFAETKELLAGYWIWEAGSLQEAVDWVKRCPNPMEGESEIEIRQIFEAEDFGDELTPEEREREERLRAESAALGDPSRAGDRRMRVMVIVKSTPATEEQMPDEAILTAMGRFNEELVREGLMLAGEGLHPSRKGARVRFSGSSRTVVDGPFVEAKELIAGFWVWRVRSLDEAIEWAKRCPNPTNGESELEIRPFFEAEDFGEAFTPELQEQEGRIRSELSARPQTH
jgi:hypothetical protein